MLKLRNYKLVLYFEPLKEKINKCYLLLDNEISNWMFFFIFIMRNQRINIYCEPTMNVCKT